ncbi:hypothetical protein BDV27DRAFT_147527 [Aspergillus caelatus]|uniref:Dienelactone hydrolase domain-containing protein n=1 Tax=Aspergillus caelatus TaxID=61420 RepID=A0A5N6ZZT2_9EURO|nr:uncharacterized protein BDV27DRAFT_147527 [Aspergillus caelatus]KAE8361800.1 hypothetical protein BDV27DRAFT_147527 [Aspergillus caelatus]
MSMLRFKPGMVVDQIEPLFLSCSEEDHTFDGPSRRMALDILQARNKTYQLQLFSGVEHGLALRGNMDDAYERYVKEQSLRGIVQWFDFWKWEIGNGRATAILLARKGAKVALVDYNVGWAQETKNLIDLDGGQSVVIQADTVETFGTVHILVNIVGFGGAMGDVTKLDLDAWDRDFKINVTSMVMMSRHVVPEVRKNGRGAIVNMSSVSGLLGGNPSLLYPTTKGAIIQMTRAMAAQHGPENIRVNCVCPGMVFTPMVRGRGMTDEMRQARINQNLLKQEGTGWDVGYAILFLCSKEAKWITGLIMPVDGGTTAGKADRPALKPDTLAEQVKGIPNKG